MPQYTGFGKCTKNLLEIISPIFGWLSIRTFTNPCISWWTSFHGQLLQSCDHWSVFGGIEESYFTLPYHDITKFYFTILLYHITLPYFTRIYMQHITPSLCPMPRGCRGLRSWIRCWAVPKAWAPCCWRRRCRCRPWRRTRSRRPRDAATLGDVCWSWRWRSPEKRICKNRGIEDIEDIKTIWKNYGKLVMFAKIGGNWGKRSATFPGKWDG